MDVYCSYTPETSQKNVISCGVSELVHSFSQSASVYVCVCTTERTEEVRQSGTGHLILFVNIKKIHIKNMFSGQMPWPDSDELKTTINNNKQQCKYLTTKPVLLWQRPCLLLMIALLKVQFFRHKTKTLITKQTQNYRIIEEIKLEIRFLF